MHHVLTQVKVRENSHRDCQLQLRLKGLSDFYVPYQHTYASVPLSRREVDMLVAFFGLPFIGRAPNPFFPYRDSVRLKTEYFNILQVRAPRACSADFQKLRIRKGKRAVVYSSVPRSGRKVFRSGYFDRQARWNLDDEANYLQPGLVVDVSPGLVALLEKKRELDLANLLVERKRREICMGLAPGEKSAVSRMISRLRKNLSSGGCSALEELVRDAVAKENAFPEFNGGLDYSPEKRVYELFLHERPALNAVRQLSLDEWLVYNFEFSSHFLNC